MLLLFCFMTLKEVSSLSLKYMLYMEFNIYKLKFGWSKRKMNEEIEKDWIIVLVDYFLASSFWLLIYICSTCYLQILISFFCLQFFSSNPLACDLSALPGLYKEEDDPTQTRDRKKYAIKLQPCNLLLLFWLALYMIY